MVLYCHLEVERPTDDKKKKNPKNFIKTKHRENAIEFPLWFHDGRCTHQTRSQQGSSLCCLDLSCPTAAWLHRTVHVSSDTGKRVVLSVSLLIVASSFLLG